MIRETLEQQDADWRKLGQVYPFRTLVLEKGQVFTPARYRGYGRRKAAQQCWSNALQLAYHNPELHYVEGLAISGALVSIGFVTPHGWCVTKDGKVVDPTWKDPHLGHYMGVVLPTDKAYFYVVRKGFYGVLNNYGGEMVDMEAIEHFFPEYRGREWKVPKEERLV